MSKFIEVHDTIINVEDIRKIEFLGDDIYLGLFPKGQNGEYIYAFIPFDGNVISLFVHLYIPEEDWIKKNRAYISMTMTQLIDILKHIKTTEKEYFD